MRITGSHDLAHPVSAVWDALLDPAVLVRVIPGCERLVATGQHEYAMTVTAGVAAVRGSYTGTCRLSDLVEHESLVMRLRGAGAPGTVDATVRVSFQAVGEAVGDETGAEPHPPAQGTRVSYDADAVVGGTVGGVGQRMLTSVARRTAAELFANVADVLSAPEPAPEAGTVATAGSEPAAVGQEFTRPPAPPGPAPGFWAGLLVGAGLVLVGVAVGAVAGRRVAEPPVHR